MPLFPSPPIHVRRARVLDSYSRSYLSLHAHLLNFHLNFVDHRIMHFFFVGLLTGRGLSTALVRSAATTHLQDGWAYTESLHRRHSSDFVVLALSTPDTCALEFLSILATLARMRRANEDNWNIRRMMVYFRIPFGSDVIE